MKTIDDRLHQLGWAFFCCLGFLLVTATRAQTTNTDRTTIPPLDKNAKGQPLTVMVSPALQARNDAFAAVRGGSRATDALPLLDNAAVAPKGTAQANLESAWAAIDVGSRLLTTDRASEAQGFFLAAETTLANATFSTTETHAQAQALYALAHVRTVYLRKYVEAQDALVQALKLEPDDEVIKAAKARLDNQYGTIIKGLRAQKGGAS